MDTPQPPQATFNISEAARLCSVDRTTLYRHIRSGKLSRLQDGTIALDELIRAGFTPHLQHDNATSDDDAMQQVATPGIDSGTVLQNELIATLQAQLDEARQREDNLQSHIKQLTNILENQQRLLSAGTPIPRKGFRDKMRQWWEAIQQTTEG